MCCLPRHPVWINGARSRQAIANATAKIYNKCATTLLSNDAMYSSVRELQLSNALLDNTMGVLLMGLGTSVLLKPVMIVLITSTQITRLPQQIG